MIILFIQRSRELYKKFDGRGFFLKLQPSLYAAFKIITGIFPTAEQVRLTFDLSNEYKKINWYVGKILPDGYLDIL